jgi:phosphatidate cytidylyltransferase
MAFNWTTFRTRSLSAVLFVAVMLTGLLGNAWTFGALFLLVHTGCWWEYLRLTEKIHRSPLHLNLRLGLILLATGLLVLWAAPGYRLGNYSLRGNLFLPLSLAGFILLVTGIFRSARIHLPALGMALAGLLYITLSWGMMLDLSFYLEKFLGPESGFTARWQPWFFPLLPLVMIASIWINDTMAYIVGSLIGRTPLSPVSPKKTWEGTAGGVILAVGVVGLSGFTWLPNRFYTPGLVTEIAPWHWVILAALAAIAGTIGDLFESKLKRLAGVKDSGNILPGHGGFLDRFDSLLLATPVIWAYVKIMM